MWRPACHAAELLVRVIELDMRDDEFAISARQTCERRAIARFQLGGDGAIERRWSGIAQALRQRRRGVPPSDAAMFVADAVANGLAQIRGERMPALRRERIETAERAQPGVLNEI
jgi:hypothetical protein